MTKNVMLEARNASIDIGGKRLFESLSFAVTGGEMLCVTGESGSGKTMLLNALMGLQPLSGGLVSIDGELLTPSSAEEFRKMMAYVPQDTAFPSEQVSGMAEMLFRLRINRGLPFSKERLMREWEMLGLDAGLYDKKTAELSGGERQRVVLSVCGMLGKQILLADEPTSALDPASSALVAGYLRAQAQRGCAVVAASHDAGLADACDIRVCLSAPAGGEAADTASQV